MSFTDMCPFHKVIDFQHILLDVMMRHFLHRLMSIDITLVHEDYKSHCIALHFTFAVS